MTLADLDILFRPFGLLAPKYFKIIWFSIFDFECSW